MTWRYNNSLDDWLTDGTTATIWCHNARFGHRGPLDLEKHVMKCSKCGGKELGMTRQPNTTGSVSAGRR